MEESLTGSTLTIDPRASNTRKNNTALLSIGPLFFFLDFSRTQLFLSLALPHRIQRSPFQVLRISLSPSCIPISPGFFLKHPRTSNPPPRHFVFSSF